MIKKYKCKQDFELAEYDDDGFYKETNMKVDKDSVWELNENDVDRIIGGEIRMILCDQEMTYTWLEVTKDTLDDYFEEI